MPRLRTAALTAAAAAAALLIPAAAASAAPPPAPPVHALTIVLDRPDGGNGSPNPYWADDSFGRSLTITLTGGSPGAWTFTAALADLGTFSTIKGAQAPNQGPGYTGDVIKAKVTGAMAGYADFSFTASTLPSAALVPAFENDHGAVPSDSTSTWYELAFPAHTVFGGAGIGDWSWRYDATVKTVTYVAVWVWERVHHHWVRVRVLVPVVHTVHQQWIDAADNGAGDLAGDGQITG